VPFIYVSVYTDVCADVGSSFLFCERYAVPRLGGVLLVFFFLKSAAAVHVSQKNATWQWMSLKNMTKVMFLPCFFVFHRTAPRYTGANFLATRQQKYYEIAHKSESLYFKRTV
jgi:hypothetical protein